MDNKYRTIISMAIAAITFILIFIPSISNIEPKGEIIIIEKFQENGSYIIKTSNGIYKEVNAGYYYNYNIGDITNDYELSAFPLYFMVTGLVLIISIGVFLMSDSAINIIIKKLTHKPDINETGGK